jgi:HAD superfamily hydrolase (TIGR01509 family)
MTLPRKPQAVVFDMDGLLFDTEALYRDSVLAVAAEDGLDLPIKLFLRTIGLPLEPTRALFTAHFGPGFDFERFWKASAVRHHELAAARRYLKTGAEELLDALDAVRLKRAIATSSSHATVQRNLKHHDLADRFHVIVAHGDYARGKPNPDPFLTAAQRLGVAPADCLALEDSYNGIRAASAAGMMTVMVPDLLGPTEEMRGLCLRIARDLHEVRTLLATSAG